jgi:hypothetical protein
MLGGGYHVRVLPRHVEPSTHFGFKTEAFIEAEKAKHRPGRRRKVA